MVNSKRQDHQSISVVSRILLPKANQAPFTPTQTEHCSKRTRLGRPGRGGEKDLLMFRGFHKTIRQYLWRFFEREMQRLIDAGDYETALRHGTNLCRRCENNVAHQYWR